MSQSISDLAKALRDAAENIENAARFRLNEEVSLSDAISFIQLHKNPTNGAKLTITIDIPRDRKDDDFVVEFVIDERYDTKAKSGRLRECLDSFAAMKSASETLKGVAKIVDGAKNDLQEKPF